MEDAGQVWALGLAPSTSKDPSLLAAINKGGGRTLPASS